MCWYACLCSDAEITSCKPVSDLIHQVNMVTLLLVCRLSLSCNVTTALHEAASLSMEKLAHMGASCNVWHAHNGLCNYHDDNGRILKE